MLRRYHYGRLMLEVTAEYASGLPGERDPSLRSELRKELIAPFAIAQSVFGRGCPLTLTRVHGR